MDDDEDDFLYGSGSQSQSQSQLQSKPPAEPTPVSQPIPADDKKSAVVSHLEAEAEAHLEGEEATPEAEPADDEEEGVAIDLEEDSDEDDVEFIMEPPTRSLDFRNQGQARPSQPRTSSSTLSPAKPVQPSPSLTTEYNPIQRGASTTSISAPPPPPPPQSASTFSAVPQPEVPVQPDDGVDTSKLPPATAAPSHPSIDPNAVGVFDGRSILEVDLAALADKPWRRPGSDITEYFNYGFDEISWEAYCYRRRDLGEMANVLKTNVLNFSGMPEEQVTALPPEVRQMVMTGTSAMMNGAAANQGMMAPPGVMMDMSGMIPMGMDMGMNPMMISDGNPGGGTGTPDQQGTMIQDGFSGGSMMGIPVGGDFAMQDQSQMNQPIYPAVETQTSSNTPTPAPTAPRATPAPFRGRGGVPPTAPGSMARGRGFPIRGRGRGGYEGVPTGPRPASPLPPNVPTGPRNQNKYKDRDNNGPAVDGLDYGGTRPSSGEPEERSSSRKRRGSSGPDEGRSSKRR